MNRWWLIERQFKIFTWHSVKATVLCNSTDTTNAVSLPWAVLGGDSPPAPPHTPMAGTGWAPAPQLCDRCRIPDSQWNLHRTSLFGSRQGYFIHFDVSIFLFPFGWHYHKPRSFCCAESKNTMLHFWAYSGVRQGWGAWSCTGAGSWLSAVQCKHFRAMNFCNM